MTLRSAIRLLAALPISLTVGAAAFAQTSPSAPEIVSPESMAVSSALRELPDASMRRMPRELRVAPAPLPTPPVPAGASRLSGETVLQSGTATGPAVTTGVSFAGIGANGFTPGDPNIAVGPSQIVQVVNSEVAVYDKTGKILAGPKSLGSIWTNLGGNCATKNAGDPIAQYDKIADRWLISQLGSVSSPYSECIAVSTSGDATGTYSLYSYNFRRNLNDYPKFGIWPTASNAAYLASYNLFKNGRVFAGVKLCAYDRTKMLAGAAAKAVCFKVSDGTGSYLPSDLDGTTPPSDGSPGYFVDFNSLSTLRMYAMAPNFAHPFFGSTLQRVSPDIAVASFTEACGGGTCIPQPSTSNVLELARRPPDVSPFLPELRQLRIDGGQPLDCRGIGGRSALVRAAIVNPRRVQPVPAGDVRTGFYLSLDGQRRAERRRADRARLQRVEQQRVPRARRDGAVFDDGSRPNGTGRHPASRQRLKHRPLYPLGRLFGNARRSERRCDVLVHQRILSDERRFFLLEHTNRLVYRRHLPVTSVATSLRPPRMRGGRSSLGSSRRMLWCDPATRSRTANFRSRAKSRNRRASAFSP